jgi:hypothetical protein
VTPALPRLDLRTVGLVLATAIVTLALAGSVNSLPGFSDHTGPTELEVTGFERLDDGCLSAVSGYGRSSVSGGVRTRNTVMRVADADAALSVHTERVTPERADVSVFLVHVESHHEGPVETDCERSAAVRYRLELTPRGGSPAGLLPDSHGTAIRYYEDGSPRGCSGGVTSPYDACPAAEEPRRAWANATDRSRTQGS